MAIEYLGLSSINGPLIALEGVQDAFYDEIVDFVVNGKEHKMGRIVKSTFSHTISPCSSRLKTRVLPCR